ncbi:MAG: DUF2061 domain-containing protein [Sphingomonadales bacterium]|nr:DUF2061 domain-containing protein [Sphingomonadales bacterium]MBD3772652.1 DUF2061 domain-containing protein [Paracoccaceae bacterium]
MFLFHGHEARSRSLVKAISWRTLGSIDTFLLGWLFTGSPGAAGAIASTEVLTKMVLYYFHERAWASVRWGFQPDDQPEEAPTLPEIIEEGGQ